MTSSAVPMSHFSQMECEAMAMMIAAEPAPIADALREQLKHVGDVHVTASGVGFFKNMALTSEAKPLPNRASFVLPGVHADIGRDEQHCVMFVLFVEDGYLRTLESVTPEDRWPEQLEPYTFSYTPRIE